MANKTASKITKQIESTKSSTTLIKKAQTMSLAKVLTS